MLICSILSSQHLQNRAFIFQWPLEMVPLAWPLSRGVDTLGLISPLDRNYFPAARSQTSELIICLSHYLVVLFWFPETLIMGQTFIAVGCSNADWKMIVSAKHLQLRWMDGWVPSRENNEAARFCTVNRVLGRPCLSPHLLIGRVQRRGWRQLMRCYCKCFSSREGHPEEEGVLQLGSVC